MVESVGVNL